LTGASAANERGLPRAKEKGSDVRHPEEKEGGSNRGYSGGQGGECWNGWKKAVRQKKKKIIRTNSYPAIVSKNPTCGGG